MSDFNHEVSLTNKLPRYAVTVDFVRFGLKLSVIGDVTWAPYFCLQDFWNFSFRTMSFRSESNCIRTLDSSSRMRLEIHMSQFSDFFSRTEDCQLCFRISIKTVGVCWIRCSPLKCKKTNAKLISVNNFSPKIFRLYDINFTVIVYTLFSAMNSFSCIDLD